LVRNCFSIIQELNYEDFSKKGRTKSLDIFQTEYIFMFQKIYSIFQSNSLQSRLLQTLILLAILFLTINVYNQYSTKKREGFQQSDRYILKENGDIYDEFYVQIYDELMLTQSRAEYETFKIIEMTQPSKDYSTFLDIGSGTGQLLNTLSKTGYSAYGIDKSKAMVGFSQTKFPDISVKCGDVKDPITFDRGTFTHILCTGMTIYEFEQKWMLFQNCYFWLQQNGYLVVHLVDKDKFNTIIPVGKPDVIDNPQKYSENRITDTIVDFIDFKYKSSFELTGSQVLHKETFTDVKTQNIRENEKTLHMESIKDILLLATKYGFLVKGKVEMKDTEGEYLYIFERMM